MRDKYVALLLSWVSSAHLTCLRYSTVAMAVVCVALLGLGVVHGSMVPNGPPDPWLPLPIPPLPPLPLPKL